MVEFFGRQGGDPMGRFSSLWNLIFLGILVSLLIFATPFRRSHGESNVIWQKLIGRASRDVAYGISALRDKTIVTAGWTGSQTDADNQQILVARLDKNGKLLWRQEMGGEGIDGATCVKATSDGGFIVVALGNSATGDFSSLHGLQDVWVLRFDASGKLLWKECYGTASYEAVFDLIEDDGYVLVGYVLSVENAEDAWVFKISTDGRLLWSNSFGDVGWDTAFSVTKWSEGYLVAGLTHLTDSSATHASADILLLYLSKDGRLIWSKTLGGSDWDQPSCVASTTDGGFVLLATSWSMELVGSNRAGDIVLFKFDRAAKQEFIARYGGSADDIARKIIEVNDGYVIGGTTWSNDGDVSKKRGGSDYWLLKTDFKGDLLWERTYGDHQDEILYGLEKVDEEYLLAGISYSYMVGLAARSHGGGDIYLVKTR